jgi:hypothetical protein
VGLLHRVLPAWSCLLNRLSAHIHFSIPRKLLGRDLFFFFPSTHFLVWNIPLYLLFLSILLSFYLHQPLYPVLNHSVTLMKAINGYSFETQGGPRLMLLTRLNYSKPYKWMAHLSIWRTLIFQALLVWECFQLPITLVALELDSNWATSSFLVYHVEHEQATCHMKPFLQWLLFSWGPSRLLLSALFVFIDSVMQHFGSVSNMTNKNKSPKTSNLWKRDNKI